MNGVCRHKVSEQQDFTRPCTQRMFSWSWSGTQVPLLGFQV